MSTNDGAYLTHWHVIIEGDGVLTEGGRPRQRGALCLQQYDAVFECQVEQECGHTARIEVCRQPCFQPCKPA